jgi:hypothetical protein
VKILRNERQVGPLEARRRGTRVARGKYLWFMDHDDTVNDEFLTVMLGAAENLTVDIVECPILFFSETAPPLLAKRFEGEQALHKGEILKAFLRGKSHNNLANKLISRPLWEKATVFLGPVSTRILTYTEDLLYVVIIYLYANSYRSTEATHYNYIYRSDSTINTRDPERIYQSLRSFSAVLSILDPILRQRAEMEDIDIFWKREVGWTLNHFLQQADRNLTPKMSFLVDSLRSRYLTCVTRGDVRSSEAPCSPEPAQS